MIGCKNFSELKDKVFLKFIIVGLLNTIFGYTFFAILIFIKINTFLSLFISTIAGIIFNYLTFGRLVFKLNKSKLMLTKFIFAYCITYILNVYLLKAFMGIFNSNAFAAQIISLPFVALFNWISLNYWVYKK
jgi:putative flippase GtrA